MKIKKTSWHYRFNNFERFDKPTDNLCNYFWRLVAKGVIILGFGGWLVLVGHLLYTSPEVLVVALFCILSVILPVLAIGFLRKKIGKALEIPGGDIAVAYIKARKEKICPLIEYV